MLKRTTFFYVLLVSYQLFFLFTNGISNSLQFLNVPTFRSNSNPACPLSAILTFETNFPVETEVNLSSDVDSFMLRYDSNQNPKDGLPVVGMKPGTHYTLIVKIKKPNSNTTKKAEPISYSTPPLPKNPLEFPKIDIIKVDKNKSEKGLTLFNPRLRIPPGSMPPQEIRKLNQSFGMLVAINSDGDVVWYYKCNSRISDFEQLTNGNFLYLTQDYTAVEIDVLGNEVNKWYATGRPEGPVDGAIPVETLTFHHDIEELSNGNFLVLGTDRRMVKDYYTSEWDKNAPRKDQLAMGDEVVEFKRDGTVVWKWSAWDYLDPYRFSYQALSGYWIRRGWPDTHDWSHCNGLEYVKEDDSILLNSRYFSAVLNIDRKSGDINWIAGEHSGWSKELQKKLLKPVNFDRWFWHQHAPKMTSNGTLLLFDNGNFQARPFDEPVPIKDTYSRVVEYKIDAENKTIEKVWSSEIDGDPHVVSFAMGSVHPVGENQNILSGWGFLLPTDRLHELKWQNALRTHTWSRVREYTHTNPTEIVWEVKLLSQEPKVNVGWTTFGARRIKQLLPQ